MNIYALKQQDLLIDNSDSKFFKSINKELAIGLAFFWSIEMLTLYTYITQMNKRGLLTAVACAALLSILCYVFYRRWGYHSLDKTLDKKELNALTSEIKFVLETLKIKEPTRLDVFRAQKTINSTKQKYIEKRPA